jgi:hypothetical protein
VALPPCRPPHTTSTAMVVAQASLPAGDASILLAVKKKMSGAKRQGGGDGGSRLEFIELNDASRYFRRGDHLSQPHPPEASPLAPSKLALFVCARSFHLPSVPLFQMSDLHNLLRDAFREFETWLLVAPWRGKEHDCVNLFVHKFIFRRISPTGPISDPTQVGIEVGVPQPPGIGIKKGARKDLVIWNDPDTSTWDAHWNPVRFPLAIIEWKARREKTNRPITDPHDLKWITAYSLLHPDHHGYCATVDFTATGRRVFTVSLKSGIAVEDFHR